MPDPTEVSDNEGEYVEIRFDDFLAESLYVKFEDKAPLAFKFPNAERMILVHDSLFCPKRKNLECKLLGNVSLPNSRTSFWKLWSAGCVDSVMLPVPKAGRAFQRIADSDEWAFSEGTPGVANPDYELGLRDCGILGGSAEYSGERWRVRGFLSGCDSLEASLEYLDFESGGGWRFEKISISGQFSVDVKSVGAIWFRMFLPEDAAPANDSLDTLLFLPEKSPVIISEIHHCPQEPMPEWVEVYNKTRYPFPLSRLAFCGRGVAFGGRQDSLRPYESVLVTKDTVGLREQLGFKDVRIFYSSMGYLNNSSGSISLCVGTLVTDSVSWNKKTVACPQGFNPHLSRAENTPGFQRASAENPSDEPFTYKFSSRVVRKNGMPLRVQVVSESSVQMMLLDSSGHRVWKLEIPPESRSWMEVPVQGHCKIGVCYVSLSVGDFERVVGIVLRP